MSTSQMFASFMSGHGLELWKSGLTEYGIDTEELYINMLESETRRMRFDCNARYMKHRQTVVDWIIDVCDASRLTAVTTHLSVCIYDAVMNISDFRKDLLQLVATACILVAAKFEEEEYRVPSIQQLQHMSDYTYDGDKIKNMEVVILACLKWDIRRVMHPLPFLGFLLNRCAVRPDDQVGGKSPSEQTLKFVTKYAEFFVDRTLSNDVFMQFSPSVIAASSLACARYANGLEPSWSTDLQTISRVDPRALSRCIEIMYRDFERMYPDYQQESAQAPKVEANEGRPQPVQQQPVAPVSLYPDEHTASLTATPSPQKTEEQFVSMDDLRVSLPES